MIKINRDERGGENMYKEFEYAKPTDPMPANMFSSSLLSEIVIIIV